MKQDIKICLPFYKMIYSIVFVVLLAFARGIVFTNEIGIAMEPPIALLAMIVCADTYLVEVQSRREDIFLLYSHRNQSKAILRRLLAQISYLIGLSALGYGLFYWQRPIPYLDSPSSIVLFLIYVSASIGSICFWGLFTMTLSSHFGNVWAGIAAALVLWFGLNSKAGERILGKWNLFSYTFQELTIPDYSWLSGKLISFLLALLLIVYIPIQRKKRG